MPSKDKPDNKTGDTTESAPEPPQSTTNVNRKKAKRRAKEAAKRQQGSADPSNHDDSHLPHPRNGNTSPPPPRKGRPPVKGIFTEEPDFPDPTSPDDAFYSGDDDPNYPPNNESLPDSSWLNTTKRKKSKSKSNQTNHANHSNHSNPISRTSTILSKPQIPTLSNAAIRASHKLSSDQIWNTSTQAERENIKQFWLELGEDERRSLVKVEKEAVLRKMKEQQKHSCSCSVCGRKRTAIEEELEVLYDAYYEELEQFANHNGDISQAPQLMAPPRPAFSRISQPMAGSFPSRGRVHEIHQDEEDDLEDDEDQYDDDEDETYSEDDGDFHHGLPPGPPDFFQFGNSLTVKDGILTVADDLLKNDGKHFIDMMEQLAERRMQREEDLHYHSQALTHRDIDQGHNHPPIDDDDDYDDDEEDDDYDSQEDEFEGDEMDSMTEEQRMEEGRRMFQIFAARMFEQRVLTAYREKVAAERQRKLLEELDEESRLDSQRQDKKAREAAKRKEKKRLQKLAKDEEKSKKDAEKAAQEQALRELEEKRLEEQRQRKEEQRKKREAEKKAAEDERLRKEAEKQRRQQEQRERQAEAEKKQREAKERERLKREELKKKERQEREAKEKEARERKAKEEKEKLARDQQSRKETESSQKADKESKPHANHFPPRNQPVALPPGLLPQTKSSNLQSPHFQVATPIVPPKTITPAARTRQPSQPGQQSHGSSPRSQKASTEISGSSASPATVAIPHTPGPIQPVKVHGHQPVLHHPQPSAPRSPLNNHGRAPQYPFNSMNGLPGLGVNGPPMGGTMMPNMMPPMPMYQGPPMGNHQRFAPNGMQYPPGFPRPYPGGHPMPFAPPPNQPPMINQQPVTKPTSHSRQASSDASSQPAPIARPGPIARPSSTTPDKQKPQRRSPDADVDQLATQLGSKALLDDSEDTFLGNGLEPRISHAPLGPPGSSRLPFASFAEHKQETFSGLGNPGWASFNPGLPPAAANWGPPSNQRPSPGWSQPPFGAIGGGPQPLPRSHLPRPILVRQNLVQACRQLSHLPSANPTGFHPATEVLRRLNANLPKDPNESGVSMEEMLLYCDTEGNAQNGGGSFEIITEPPSRGQGQAIRFLDDSNNLNGPRSIVGDIGSPMTRF